MKFTNFQIVQVLVALLSSSSSDAFAPRFGVVRSSSILQLDMAKIGIFFGTSTGNTESVADMIAAGLGDDAEGPFDVDSLDGPVKDVFGKYDALIVGTPTWNTGADTERSGTGWDELYYTSMPEMKMQGKKVAVFGLGDQESYAENYADATGELHDVFQGLGCQMMGYTSQEGYEHEDSKSIRGDLFCGLLCDMINQEELSEERVQNWIAQLKGEGFLEGGSSVTAAAPVAAAVAAPKEVHFSPEIDTREELIEHMQENNAKMHKTLDHLDEHSDKTNTGFTPYYNAVSKSTMWVSPDGRQCYYTADASKTTVSS
jgi:flavodoxin I